MIRDTQTFPFTQLPVLRQEGLKLVTDITQNWLILVKIFTQQNAKFPYPRFMEAALAFLSIERMKN